MNLPANQTETPAGAARHPYSEFEHAGWQRAAAAYAETFGEVSNCFVPALLDAVAIDAGAGLLDVASRSATFYVPSGLNKVAPVLSRLEMWGNPAFIVINKGIYDKLSAPQRDALQRASARLSAAENRKELRAFESMIRGIHEKGGGQVAQANCRVTV